MSKILTRSGKVKKEAFTARTQLSPLWARRLVLGHVLQCFEPPAGAHNTTATLVQLQARLSERWRMPVEPTSTSDTREMLKTLGRYATGEGALPTDTLRLLTDVLRPLAVGDLSIPHNMHRLLVNMQFTEERDNLFRVSSRLDFRHDPAVASVVPGMVSRRDPYDTMRTPILDNIYAIDSKSTSEVDDAIGVSVDEKGVEWITVFVSDATTNCPFDSQVEVLTARRLTTTSYLPEAVDFMLPKDIVEAATLREDRPCRTFNIRFRIDERTSEVCDVSVSLGWAHALRRITYDSVQDLYDTGSAVPTASSPAWCSSEDVAKLQRLRALAERRCAARRQRMQQRSGRIIDGDLPEPLIRVVGTEVVSVEDQILGTKDARLAVAEMMIAANEACSRLAQRRGIVMPYRGTRPLSTDHDAARANTTRAGVHQFPATLKDAVGRIFGSVASLSGVSRAIYHHEPLEHVGLDTHDYCHATSPLRRYPDMLVHHQLKVAIALDQGHTFEADIPPFLMAELCAHCSTVQEQAALLQDRSARFWLLTFIRDSICAGSTSTAIEVVVGTTTYVAASAEDGSGGASPRPPYLSDVFIPRLQMLHVMRHAHKELVPGMTAQCHVRTCDPLTGVLELVPKTWEFREHTARDFIEKTVIPTSLGSRS